MQTGYTQKYPGKFVKYKLDADITLTTQAIPGLTLEDVRFAIVCKPNGTGDRKYSITDRYLAYHAFYDLNGRRYDIPSENPVYKALEEGRFIVHRYGESDNIYFGTPFMDKDQLKGVVVEVPEDTDVKLGVVARFHSDQYDEPIIFKARNNNRYKKKAFPFTGRLFSCLKHLQPLKTQEGLDFSAKFATIEIGTDSQQTKNSKERKEKRT